MSAAKAKNPTSSLGLVAKSFDVAAAQIIFARRVACFQILQKTAKFYLVVAMSVKKKN
jgi:hypothetical protein